MAINEWIIPWWKQPENTTEENPNPIDIREPTRKARE